MLALEGMMNAQRNRGMYLRVDERLCLNGVGHDDDSPNAASFDAANPNCACKPEPCADARHRQTVNEWPVPKKAPNPTDRHIGSRVRMRRKMLAMSQTQLADALLVLRPLRPPAIHKCSLEGRLLSNDVVKRASVTSLLQF